MVVPVDVHSELVRLGRLMLEDICSDIVRFLHSRGDPARFESVRIDREFALGLPGAFADLWVEPDDEPPYFLEVKYGHDAETLLTGLHRKYSSIPPQAARSTKVVLVVDTASHADWPAVEARLHTALPSHLSLEVWDEARLQRLVAECFGQTIPSFAASELLSIREAVDKSRERLAFGDTSATTYSEAVLHQNLLWHFSAWRLAELRQALGIADPTPLIPPRAYEHAVVVMADLSGFSRYMRDTPDDSIVRHALTNFYAKARYQVINAGGMLDQFVGDEIVAVFGVPDCRPGYVDAAVRTSFRLLDIGESVTKSWQREIDLAQPQSGVHISMAMGRVQLVAMRALDHAHLAVIGDCLNIAARLLQLSHQGQIVISNVLHHALQESTYEFLELEPFEAHDIGSLRSWRLLPPKPVTGLTA